MATIKDFMVCPKCGKKFLGKSIPQKVGKEYFCHYDHIYFGLAELVNEWGYDAGDFPVSSGVNFMDVRRIQGVYEIRAAIKSALYTEIIQVDTLQEPEWEDFGEYLEAYEMAGRMFLGISEIDDYLDLKDTQECALQAGLQ